MFAAWGTWVARFRWPVFAVTLAAVIGAGVWGMGVFGQLTEGGYNDPNSESTRAAEVVQQALGARGGDVVVIYTPAQGTIDDAVLAQRVENRLTALPRDAVTATTSYWQDKAPQYVSQDKRSAVAVLTLAGDGEAEKLASYREIDDRLDVAGARHEIAGGTALSDASSTLSTQDLAVAEAISLPIVLILLLLIFGSLVAAALPVLVGGAAVLGSLGVLHGIAYSHDVNSFAVNVASLLGLGMAIDYGLFMVGRFREEQAYGRTPAEAVTRTVATAGRTVAFSATLLMIALAGLMLFPQGFLKSLAYGGLAAVALAAVLSLTLLPAVLAILGPRVDKLPIRLPKRRNAAPAGTGWARLADIVLHRPILVALPLLAGLLILAAPIRGVTFGEADERVLPAANPARQAIETLKSDFPVLSSAGVQVVLHGAGAEGGAITFSESVAKVPGVATVTPAGAKGDVVALTATLRDKDPFSTPARDAVADIRALQPPPGTELLVGGTTARNVDSLEATADRLPLMIGLLVGATLLLMFLAFGSILLPIKAVVVSAISLAATFGILVWIFQDGHGAGLLNITPAPPEVGIVVLMAAVVFGLSTDYEVFLLSRMVEARTRGATTAEAVTTGLARTGRVISAAALLLIVVTGAFALSSVTTMRFVGIGMIIALVLDATVVRMLLVPAILSVLGDAAWWAPGPLRRLQEKAGLAEYAGEELFPTVSVGRHAAPDTVARAASGAAVRPRHASAEPGGVPAWATGAVRELPAAGPVSGAPASAASGAPTSGAPVSGAPVSGAPVSGAPVSGAPVSGAPASGAPISGGPASGLPVSPGTGVAISGAPTSDAPASAAPASDAPTPGAPEAGSPTPGVPVSPGPGGPVSPGRGASASAPSGLPASPDSDATAAPVPDVPVSPASGLPASPHLRLPPSPPSGLPASPASDIPASQSSGVQASPPSGLPAAGVPAGSAPGGEAGPAIGVASGSASGGEAGPAIGVAAGSASVPATDSESAVAAVPPPDADRADGSAASPDDEGSSGPGDEGSSGPGTGSAPASETAPSGGGASGADTSAVPPATPTSSSTSGSSPSEESARVPVSERPTVRIPTGEQAQVRVPTGEQAPVRNPAAAPPARVPTGEQPPVRVPTGEQTPLRAPSGEQASLRTPTGEQGLPRPTGDQPPVKPPAGEPSSVPVIAGNPPADPQQRAQPPGDPDGDGQEGTASEDVAPEALETVDLSARMGRQPDVHESEEPSADTTAVLELGPTVDLSARLEQEKAQRRR